MKILFAVFSCQMRANLGSHRAARETWLRDLDSLSDAEYRFFIGRGGEETPDTIVLDAPDGYEGLTEKNREVQRWFMTRDYDFMFFCDDDTLVNVPLLMKSGFNQADYFSRWRTSLAQCPNGYACTGNGVFLSRRACQILTVAPVNTWADDVWIAAELHKQGIRLTQNSGFGTGPVTFHGSEYASRLASYDPSWMYKKYEEIKACAS